MQWVLDGKIKPHVSATYPLKQAVEALDQVVTRKSTGKVVIAASDALDRQFFYHWARTPLFNRQLVATASGSKILHTAPGRIEAASIDLPPIAEQRAMAEVLGAIDGQIAAILDIASQDADILIIEGVMGLFDGPRGSLRGSTADLAHLLQVPVLLTVDARHQGQSVAALVHGFTRFKLGLKSGGVHHAVLTIQGTMTDGEEPP